MPPYTTTVSRIPRHHKSTLPPPDRAVERLLRIKQAPVPSGVFGSTPVGVGQSRA